MSCCLVIAEQGKEEPNPSDHWDYIQRNALLELLQKTRTFAAHVLPGLQHEALPLLYWSSG